VQGIDEKSKNGKWEERDWTTCMTVSEIQLWDTNGHVEETNRSVRDRGGDLGRANAATAAP
jgi:hypothetical protein